MRKFLVVFIGLLGCGATHEERSDTQHSSPDVETPSPLTESSMTSYAKPSLDVIRKTLSPMAFEVTQNAGTEPPFRNAFWDHHEEGLYVDVVTGEPLFASVDKFDSGTGWPSFSKPVDPKRVVSKVDVSHGMRRVEVRSKDGDSHLGHVFDDGPAPTGERYCINSASLRFVPKDKLAAEGYGAYSSLFGGPVATPSASSNSCALPPPGEKAGCETTFETAILAGGCFWGMEDLLRKIPGVVETEVGYTGGTTPEPTYELMKTGRTGHAEAVRITFDPAKVTYAELLEGWFFKMHDPTTRDRQGNDRGSQYRSAIFYTTPEQKETALRILKKVDDSGKWGAPIVTEVTEASTFTLAEDYHQDYLEKHPGGYSCHFMRD